MPIRSAINDLVPDVQAWRREIHQNPGLLYDVEGTAQFVADRLRAFGCDEVKTSIGRTGVVGVIRGAKGASPRTIGLRADMDALPIEEETNLPYRSKIPGKMHACGHDGHTAMLLGAAQRLAQTRDFAGNAIVIFQPAEEGGAGAMAMIDDGLMDNFGIEEVYGMHNMPSLPVGSFRLRTGPLMASADEITITVEGQGGHGAMPHQGVDPVVVGAQIVVALQTIVSRNVDPLDSCVVSVTRFEAGTASNIIPQSAWLNGTVRTLKAATRDAVEKRIHEIAAGVAAAGGATARVEYRRAHHFLRVSTTMVRLGLGKQIRVLFWTVAQTTNDITPENTCAKSVDRLHACHIRRNTCDDRYHERHGINGHGHDCHPRSARQKGGPEDTHIEPCFRSNRERS